MIRFHITVSDPKLGIRKEPLEGNSAANLVKEGLHFLTFGVKLCMLFVFPWDVKNVRQF